MENLKILFVMYSLSTAPLVIYALKRSGRRFSILTLCKQNYNRLISGAVAVILFTVILLIMEPADLSSLLKPFSISIDPAGTKTGIAGAIGLAIGAFSVLALETKKK